MVESSGLLNRRTGVNPVPRVRIPPSPPFDAYFISLLIVGQVDQESPKLNRYLYDNEYS